MAIPAYDQMYRAVLETLSDGKVHSSKETITHCAQVFHLREEEKEEMLQSGRQSVLANRVGWARTYLKHAGLITSPCRGHYLITEDGKKALQDENVTIDNAYLSRFSGFNEFFRGSETGNSVSAQTKSDDTEKTPLEIMDVAYKGINDQLADDLMSNIMDQSPAFFERLVIDLLEKMGYGGHLINPGQVTGKTGDEGIDGIITEDVLGFEKIYVQAKRWSDDHVVGEPDIQQFAGALMGKGANKGLFITTSHFSKQAQNFVDKHMTAKIVLVDGKKLTDLMIQYGVGVSTVHTYEIRRTDTDYFNDNNE